MYLTICSSIFSNVVTHQRLTGNAASLQEICTNFKKEYTLNTFTMVTIFVNLVITLCPLKYIYRCACACRGTCAILSAVQLVNLLISRLGAVS